MYGEGAGCARRGLLLMLLLLQNRGRMTAAQLASELDVSRRTVLRDIEALGEAGLPVVVHRGPRGGVELGFGYRTRLTGLATDEAEALGVVLAAPVPALAELGLVEAGARARTKLVESLPDQVRATVRRSQDRVGFALGPPAEPDPRVGALAEAIRGRRVVRLDARSASPVVVHPVRLLCAADGWAVVDARAPDHPVPQRDWHTVNVSALDVLDSAIRDRPRGGTPRPRSPGRRRAAGAAPGSATPARRHPRRTTPSRRGAAARAARHPRGRRPQHELDGEQVTARGEQ